jgi:hypothetical protein
MNARHRKLLSPRRPQSVYEILAQRAEEAAERDGLYSNSGIIQRLREHMFSDVDALEKSGTVKIPE